MKTILFVDDDEISHKLVKHSLGPEFEIVSCYSIAEANRFLDTNPVVSLIIIDRGLPDGDGIAICSRLRQEDQTQSVPVIFLSSAGAEIDKVGAFFAGADDYITKPFGPLELKARVQARLRQSSKKIFAADLEVDLNSHRAHYRSPTGPQEIDLTRTEFKILVTLVQSLDQVFNREKLLVKVWGLECNVSDRVVDSHISHLRKKISHTGLNLESLRGEGYRMTIATPRKNQTA